MPRITIFVSLFYLCVFSVGAIALRQSRQGDSPVQSSAAKPTQNFPLKVKSYTLTLAAGEIRSLEWIGNHHLWIVKNSSREERSYVTIWNVQTGAQVTHAAPSRCERQNFMPNSDGTLSVGFGYNNLSNHLWQTGKENFKTTSRFQPITFVDQYLLGWSLDKGSNIKITWWNVITGKAKSATSVQLPRRYSCYFSGHCGEVGPLLNLSRDGKVGFLGLFKSADDGSLSSFDRILTFDAQTGKPLRVMEIATEHEEIDPWLGFLSTPDSNRLLIFKNRFKAQDSEVLLRTLELRDAHRGRLLRSWPIHGEAGAIDISDDAKVFSIYQPDKKLMRIYETRTGRLWREINVDAEVYKLGTDLRIKLSPDHRYIAFTGSRVSSSNPTVIVRRLF